MAQACLAGAGWIAAPATRTVVAALDRAGLDFRFVGGAVRDSLLGRAVSDVDIATPARPDQIIGAAAAAGLRAIPTGLAHGTVTVIADRQNFEITTLRRDVATDGRRATVAFTDDWHEDAARRDFTMNALYADRHGALTDFFGGVDDARAGRVRFIGDPDRRIAEDALRILRFFRFHAWYGRGAIDPSGLAAVAAAAPGLDRLSGERIRDEFLKLLRAPDPLPVWRAMTDVGVMAHLVPDANHIEDAVRLIAVEAALGLAADPLRRLAALTGLLDDERLATIRARLKLANRDGDWLAALATPRPQLGSLSDATFGAALYGAPPQQVCDAALIAYARSGRPDLPVIRALLDFASRWTEPRLPISGADIVARGVSPGPALGAVLGEVEAWWVAHNFNADRRECLEELDRRLRGGPRQ